MATVFVLLLVSLGSPRSLAPSSAYAQSGTRLFPETGKTVQGKFLDYWNTHGGLAQQGFPISDEMQEKSITDGKTYTVQYFERAVFELHPENQPPYDVLLSLLGTFSYGDRYGRAGAPNQSPNTSDGSIVFPETGKRLGGVFLTYWQQNGALPQQGYPISDEFEERSSLDGKTYTVQYFERAVFELHPENQPPYNVLLSQLGTFQYRARYLQPTTTPTLTAVPSTPTALPISTPVPTNTPNINDCSGIPDNQGVQIDPRCAPLFSEFTINSSGWTDDNLVGIWATMPNGQPFGAPFDVPVRSGATVVVRLTVDDQTPYFGVWTITMEGLRTHKRIYGYFKVTPYQPTPTR